MLSDRCPVLSVGNVDVLLCQTAGWIQMKLGTEVGLGPSHNVLDGDPAPPKEAQLPIFGPCLLWPIGSMDQDATWYSGKRRPRRHCVRRGPSSAPEMSIATPSFCPTSIVAKRLLISATGELSLFYSPYVAHYKRDIDKNVFISMAHNKGICILFMQHLWTF